MDRIGIWMCRRFVECARRRKEKEEKGKYEEEEKENELQLGARTTLGYSSTSIKKYCLNSRAQRPHVIDRVRWSMSALNIFRPDSISVPTT